MTGRHWEVPQGRLELRVDGDRGDPPYQLVANDRWELARFWSEDAAVFFAESLARELLEPVLSSVRIEHAVAVALKLMREQAEDTRGRP